MTQEFDELVSHAHDTRVVVVGGGIAGLVAARRCWWAAGLLTSDALVGGARRGLKDCETGAWTLGQRLASFLDRRCQRG